jgi:hypothetical protein
VSNSRVSAEGAKQQAYDALNAAPVRRRAAVIAAHCDTRVQIPGPLDHVEQRAGIGYPSEGTGWPAASRETQGRLRLTHLRIRPVWADSAYGCDPLTGWIVGDNRRHLTQLAASDETAQG